MLHSFPFHFCVVHFLLLCHVVRCLGWWPKEPAGLKTLRLVSMPSWRHASSEEQEEEDDDDVVGPSGDASIPAGIAGPSESLRFSRSPVTRVFFTIHLGIWVPKNVVKANCAPGTVRWSWSGNYFASLRTVGTEGIMVLEVSSSFETWRPLAFLWPCCVAWVQIAKLWKV